MNAGTFAYGTAAGASLAIGFLFLVIGTRRERFEPMDLALSVFGFAGAASTFATVEMQSSVDAESYQSAIQGPFAWSALVFVVAAVWVVSIASDVGGRAAPWGLTAGVVVVGLVNQLSPGGVIVQHVEALRPVSLFGESFVVHEPNRSDWRPVLDVLMLAVVGYFVVALFLRWKRNGRRLDPLLTGIGLVSLALGYDSLVDEGVVATSYLAPFGYVVFVIAVAAQHGAEITESQRLLASQSAELEAMVVDRTQSLRDANRRLLEGSRRQQESTRRLGRLTERFVALSDIVASSDADEDEFGSALREATRTIGGAIDATTVSLDYLEPEHSQPRSVHWSSPAGEAQDHDGELVQSTHVLRAGAEVIGEIRFRRDGPGAFSDEHLRLMELSAEFLGNLLHRAHLERALVVQVVGEERQRIARELHDSTSQRLYAAAFNADVLATTTQHDPAFAAFQAQKIRTLVLSSLAELRTLLFELQPQALDDASLTGLIDSLCESMGATYEFPIEVDLQAGPPIPSGPKLALYRIVQESLGNALRHADAATVSVAVSVDAAGAGIEVVDDGRGFDVESGTLGNGLRNIEARAQEVGADLTVSCPDTGGTRVSVTWGRDSGDSPDSSIEARRSELAQQP